MRNELAAYNERLAGRPGNEARLRDILSPTNDPLLQRELRLLEEAAVPDTAALLAGVIWASPPDK